MFLIHLSIIYLTFFIYLCSLNIINLCFIFLVWSKCAEGTAHIHTNFRLEGWIPGRPENMLHHLESCPFNTAVHPQALEEYNKMRPTRGRRSDTISVQNACM